MQFLERQHINLSFNHSARYAAISATFFNKVYSLYIYCFFQVVPASMRLDRGTENCKLAECQVFLRRNHRDALAGIHSVTYGRSKLNQVWQIKYHVLNV
jgi:hypothetical protein